MMDYRTNSIDHSSEIFLGPESESLEKLIDSGGTTFCVPVVKPSSCSWCGQLICTVRFFSGRWVFAEVVTEPGGAFLANLLHDHHCKPMERWERQHLETPEDPWAGWESE